MGGCRGIVGRRRDDVGARVWRARVDEVLALGSLDERGAYAARNGVDYVIGPRGEAPALYRVGALCAFDASTR